eukprot:scaffold8150_cov72-Phaeocystis_antarctica.AAC.2
MPPPTHLRVQRRHQGFPRGCLLELALLGPGEPLPGQAQELLPLRVPQVSRQQRPQLQAELVERARERPLLGPLGRRRGSQPGGGWPLGG